VPGKELNFERAFDETWLDFLRSEGGIWGLFTQIGIRSYLHFRYIFALERINFRWFGGFGPGQN
jgi:hypothetical protein